MEAELRRRHEVQREAHLGADADRLVSLFADDFVSVQDGVVSRPSRAQSRARFQRYFDLVTFLAWDDIEEPVIELAADGSLATILVRKRVHLTHPGGEEETVFAWLETWRHRDDRWELAMVVSTRQAPAADQVDGRGAGGSNGDES